MNGLPFAEQFEIRILEIRPGNRLVSGYRFSDTAGRPKSDAPLGLELLPQLLKE
jgi:hypothetical protein